LILIWLSESIPWKNRNGGDGTLRRPAARRADSTRASAGAPFIGVNKFAGELNVRTVGHTCFLFPAYHHFRNVAVSTDEIKKPAEFFEGTA
jgi:hypothetical protein